MLAASDFLAGSRIAEVSAAGLLAVVILREVFRFLKEKDSKKPNGFWQRWEKEFKVMVEQTRKMYEMHNVFDEDHVPVWHMRKSMIKAIEAMKDESKKHTLILEQIKEILQSTRDGDR